MWRFKRGCLVSAVAAVLFLALRGCPSKPTVPTGLLHDNDRQAVFVDTRRKQVVIQEPGKQPIIKEGVRHAELHITKDGRLDISVRSRGFSIEPGVSGFYSRGAFLLGMDSTLYYGGRFDYRLGLGLLPDRLDSIRGYAAVGYPLPHLPNTSIFVGETTDFFLDPGLKGFIENLAAGIRIGL